MIGIFVIIIIFLLISYGSRDPSTPVYKSMIHVSNLSEGKVPITGGDGRRYYILNDKPNRETAGKLIAELNEFMVNFIIALKHKYLYNERTCFTEPEFKPDNEFVPYDKSCGVDNPLTDFRIRAVFILVTRYRPNSLEENQPTSPKDTSWAEGKGDRVALCLREQASGKYEFIDKELIKFVAIHELTHIAANTLDHPYYFWKVFKFLLVEAKQLMGYKLVDYQHNPVNYCSMNVTYNPVYDANIDITKNESRDITSL
jgi:hypothetical protein